MKMQTGTADALNLRNTRKNYKHKHTKYKQIWLRQIGKNKIYLVNFMGIAPSEWHLTP